MTFAALAATLGQLELGLRLAGAVGAQRETLGMPMGPTERAKLELWLPRARAQLDAVIADSADSAGRALALEEAIAEASAIRLPARLPEPDLAAGVQA